MFPGPADQLNAKGHDVRAVVADPEFTGLPDEDVLIGATEAGRALITADIRTACRSTRATARPAGRTPAWSW